MDIRELSADQTAKSMTGTEAGMGIIRRLNHFFDYRMDAPIQTSISPTPRLFQYG